MQLHELKSTVPKKTAKRIGLGGKRGKTSGRGGKGQTARAGNSTRPEMRDFIKKLPKLRGFGKNRGRTVNSGKEEIIAVNLNKLESVYKEGETVSSKTLVEKGILKRLGNKLPKVKILATGEITKKLKIENCQVSDAAKVKLEKAGGEVKK